MVDLHRIFNVTAADTNMRLDQMLARLNPDLSRSRIQHIIEQQGVSVDEKIINAPACKVKQGQTLRFTIPEPETLNLTPENIPLDIIFEDDHIVVVNKKPGMVVHPSLGHTHHTLVHALLHHCQSSLSGIGDVQRPGIVHRLDKGTSGLMVVAKTDAAHAGLSTQFSSHTLTRQYLAFCWGLTHLTQGKIETWIGRHPHHRQKMAVTDLLGRGKKAITFYRTIRHRTPISMIECTLQTGRTHQVRVHMNHLGHSLVGDPLYGQTPRLRHLKDFEEIHQHAHTLECAERPALHSVCLAFEHPVSHAQLSFHAPLPDDLQILAHYIDYTGP